MLEDLATAADIDEAIAYESIAYYEPALYAAKTQQATFAAFGGESPPLRDLLYPLDGDGLAPLDPDAVRAAMASLRGAPCPPA